MQSAGNDFELLYIRLRCLKNTEASSFFNFFFIKPKKETMDAFFFPSFCNLYLSTYFSVIYCHLLRIQTSAPAASRPSAPEP